MSATKLSINKTWAQLGKPTNRDEWGMTASTVNAYYNPSGNEIVFPAGIMQFPLFGGDLPGFINYASFGAVAGHELSHAFDPNGRHYDVDGKLKDWWTNRTSDEYDKRAQCFVDEYNNFTVPGSNGTVIHVNGKQTLGENVADAGGLSAAWAAWQKRRQTKPDLDLPGLGYFTQEQIFYISYANVWCSKYRPEMLVSRVRSDEHSPNMYRIIGTAMMNSKGFRQAFNCPKKEPVCEIW
jgi:endothelin-converting enzyme